MIAKVFLTVMGGIALGISIAAIIAYPVMWLWNFTMPEMFGLKEIDFWHSLAFAVLCGLLFKSSTSSNSNNQ